MPSSSSRRRSRSSESCRGCLWSHVYDSPTPHPWETARCLAPEEGGGEAETGKRKWLCALSQGSQGRAEGQELRTEGGERQLRAAAQDQLLPLLAGRLEQVVGQLEAWSRARLPGRGGPESNLPVLWDGEWRLYRPESVSSTVRQEVPLTAPLARGADYVQSLRGQWSERGNSHLDTSSSKPSCSLHSGNAHAEASQGSLLLARVRTLACTWGSWKGGPPSCHNPISQHPPCLQEHLCQRWSVG